MAGPDVLHFMDKNDLECAICLFRLHQPKTLRCTHTYCLHCIQKCVETHGKMKCPKCVQLDLTNEDLKQVDSDTMICRQLEYVVKTEDQKPSKCCGCANQPVYHCSDCQLYICQECINHHTIIPSLRNHTLYTLDVQEQTGNSDKPTMCTIHVNTSLEFYCSTCSRTACKLCEHIFRCYQNKHNVIPVSTAVDELNSNVTEATTLAQEIENKLIEHLKDLEKERLLFDPQLNQSKTAVGNQESTLIRTIQEKAKDLRSDLEKIYKEQADNLDSQVKNIDSKLAQVKYLMATIDKIKPKESKHLGDHKTTINGIIDRLIGTEFDRLFHKQNSTPNFIPSEHLAEMINSKGIGKITHTDGGFEIAKDDQSMTVTKDQPFDIVVKVSSQAESGSCQLSAKLTNFAGKESDAEVKFQENGEYKITGRCDIEGDWQMEITAGVANIKGSPVDIKVEQLGLSHTINVSTNAEANTSEDVTSVELDKHGCLLVSNFSNTILKFKPAGSFIGKIVVPHNGHVNSMYQMTDGHMIYSDDRRRYVVMCDDTFKEIRSFGKGIFKYPMGVIVNEDTRILYVADYEAHCVFKFNVDNGILLGLVCSESLEIIKKPSDICLTKDGHVIVVGNNQLLMFDSNDNSVKSIIASGEEEGKVLSPWDATMDMDENILVSSNHKLQLFDKRGKFLRRIDEKDDGLDEPYSICIISNRPRRVAVANHGANNVKIFNY